MCNTISSSKVRFMGFIASGLFFLAALRTYQSTVVMSQYRNVETTYERICFQLMLLVDICYFFCRDYDRGLAEKREVEMFIIIWLFITFESDLIFQTLIINLPIGPYFIVFIYFLFQIFYLLSQYLSSLRMGGGGSRTVTQTVVHRVQDPNTLRQLEQSRKQIQNLTAQVGNLESQLSVVFKKANNPQHFKELKNQLFNTFLTNIQKVKFEEKIPKNAGEKHHVVIGNISAGKTTLINYFCKTNLPVGIGQTTKQPQKVAASQDKKIHIWDSPGVNEDFAFYDVDILAFFHTADRIFILFNSSLKSCKQLVLVLYKIKPSNTFLVRTQCDRWHQGMNKTIQQEIIEDRRLLSQWGVHLQVLAVSCKKDMSMTFMDNRRCQQLFLHRNEFFDTKPKFYTDFNGWIRAVIQVGDTVTSQLGGNLTVEDVKNMNIVGVGWSDNFETMYANNSWYINKASFYCEDSEPWNALTNVLNGNAPNGEQWTPGYDKGYLYCEGVLDTYSDFKYFFAGQKQDCVIEMGSPVLLRIGGNPDNPGEFVNVNCNGYSQGQNCIASCLQGQGIRVLWIKTA